MKQYDICIVNLDPALGFEIKKIRPCIIISPDEMNDNIKTVIIAPMTTKSHNYPTRVPVNFEKKSGWIVIDQIRTIDRQRIVKTAGRLTAGEINNVKDVIRKMLVD